MKTIFHILAILFAVSASASAQVVPEASGGKGLPLSGNLDYSVRYSETADFGSIQGNWQTSNVSASASYANAKQRLPFSLTYGGGYGWSTGNATYGSGIFQNLTLSQGIVGRHWRFMASDNAGFHKQAPTTGFSGEPGTGEPIGASGSDTTVTQSILTVNTETVNNNVTGTFARDLGRATTLSAGGAYSQLIYPNGDGQDTNGLSANATYTRRLNARTSISGAYTFSQYSYPASTLTGSLGSNFTSTGNSTVLTYHRQWTRGFSTNATIGPQWIGSSDSTVVPSSTRFTANASATYQYKFESASASYSHGMNGGAGYLLGAESDDVSLNFSREIGRKASIGLTTSYMRTSGLNTGEAIDGVIGAAQASRPLGRYMSVFASYTAIDQWSNNPLPTNAISGLYSVIAAGFGYSPRGIHLRH
jgi:hypothetical protein